VIKVYYSDYLIGNSNLLFTIAITIIEIVGADRLRIKIDDSLMNGWGPSNVGVLLWCTLH
jgi:hypothetical protein